MLLAQKKIIGERFQTIFLDNINDITFQSGMMYGVITVDTIKEKFNVTLSKSKARNLNDEIHDVLHMAKQKEKTVPTASSLEPIVELKKYKELLDAGIITQEDFDAKKKQLLNI